MNVMDTPKVHILKTYMEKRLPLHWAVENTNKDVARLLIAYGADAHQL